jgi:hypothetical protein
MASYLGIALPGSKRALLAYRNLRRAGGRWWVSLFGIFFATFLMSIQGSLLYGFAAAASRTVDAVDADIWMVAKGTPAFEFVSQIPDDMPISHLGLTVYQPPDAASLHGLRFSAVMENEHTFLRLASRTHFEVASLR